MGTWEHRAILEGNKRTMTSPPPGEPKQRALKAGILNPAKIRRENPYRGNPLQKVAKGGS